LLCGGEQLRIDELGTQNDLSVMNRLDLGSVDHEVASGLDIDDQVIAFDPTNCTDLLAALLEKDVVADTDFEVVSHSFDLRREV
jgi:hypothetical protein